MTTTIRQEQLANGLQIDFVDESRRYFGDYHRVCVVATIICKLDQLPASTAEEVAFRDQARATIGEQFITVKRFERMGVPTEDVTAVRSALIDDFLRHAAPYLARSGYPRSLVKAALNVKPAYRSYD